MQQETVRSLSMTRDWARSLVAYEAEHDAIAGQPEPVSARVYEHLRHRLCSFAGVGAFQTLAFRALTLARSKSPGLSAVQVTTLGCLRGLSEVESHADKGQDGECGVLLIAQLLELVVTFLGEATTFCLIEDLCLRVDIGMETSTAGTTPAATHAELANAFEDLMEETHRLRKVSRSLETMAHRHSGMEEGLLSIAGNISNIATMLDIFTLLRSKFDPRKEEENPETSTGYVM